MKKVRKFKVLEIQKSIPEGRFSVGELCVMSEENSSFWTVCLYSNLYDEHWWFDPEKVEEVFDEE